jgi:hypothetical protein
MGTEFTPSQLSRTLAHGPEVRLVVHPGVSALDVWHGCGHARPARRAPSRQHHHQARGSVIVPALPFSETRRRTENDDRRVRQALVADVGERRRQPSVPMRLP